MATTLHEDIGTATASAGTFSVTIRAFESILAQAFVKATTGTTTFDVKLTDSHGNVRYEFKDVTGVLSDLTPLPSKGNYTLTVSNSSADEAFTYSFIFKES